MGDWIYVDNSNVFIEGQRASAVQKCMASDINTAMAERIVDTGYRINFGKLYQFIAGSNRHETVRAMLFGSRPPENDAIWNMASNAGFEVVVEDRNVANREKKIDTGIVTEMMRDACKHATAGDVFTLVSGDSDYVPTVEALIQEGYEVDVVFWDHASMELKKVCSRFVSLNPHLETIGF